MRWGQMQRMSQESPTCEFEFLAAHTRSGGYAASALFGVLQCDGKTSHSDVLQRLTFEIAGQFLQLPNNETGCATPNQI